MKKFKKLVGLLLCLAMVLSFVPATIIGAAAADTGAKAVATSDILEKIDLSGTVVGTCSSPYSSSASYKNQNWYSSQNPGWKTLDKLVNGSTSDEITYSISSGERGDVYLDLTKKGGSAISATQFKMYYGAGSSTASMPSVTVILELADGSTEQKTFTTNWSGTSAGTPIEWDFGETLDIEGIYAYTPTGTKFSVSEIELYGYVEVPYLETANLNGVDIGEYTIVYSNDDLDYAYTAAEYIQEQILMRTGRQVDIVEDNTAETTYEILVGNTNRSYSKSFSAPNETAMKFTFASNGTKIALKADYFIIAGAAYYFIDTYVGTADFNVTANTGVTIQNTITKPAKNYIFMIGDGMGEMHTRLFDIYDVPTSGDYAYSDGEDIFYGYYLPYFGWQKTANIGGTITDSAAAGTALSCGYKTINGYVGKDQYLNDVKSMSELAMEFNKSVAVMSTEGCDGATPAAYSAHSEGRYDSDVEESQKSFKGLLIDGYNNYNTFTASEYEEWEARVRAGLNAVKDDPDGFFIMYEEAHIDKVSHRLNYTSSAGYTGDTSRETLFRTVYRFNQAIGLFMEYALYNPDTMLLITADHETAGLDKNWEPTEQNPVNEQQGGSVWNHSLKDVPVFSYGAGAEVFDGVTAENASYARTWADLMTEGNADDFGNPAYPIIGSGESGEEDEGQNFYTDLPAGATKVDVSVPTVGYYSDKDTNGAITEYVDAEDGPENLIDGIYDQKDNRTISGYYTYEELADGTKIPVIMFEFDEDVNVAGIKLTGYEFGRYNIEDFDIEVYAHDGYSTSWYTAATVRDAFTSGGTGQITTPLEIGFHQIRTATKMRIIVKGITNMSAEAGDDAESAELATGSYFRIKEIEVYETEAPTVTPQPTQPTEPSEPDETEPTSPVSGNLPQGQVYRIVNNALYINGDKAGYIDAGGDFIVKDDCLADGAYGRAGYLNEDIDGEIAAIAQLELSKTFNIGAIEISGDVRNDLDPTEFEIQAWVDGEWKTVKTVTNGFAGALRTERYTFTPVETDKIRLYITEHDGAYCSIGEIELYEVTTGDLVEEIDLTGSNPQSSASVSEVPNGYLPGANVTIADICDGDKTTHIALDSETPTITFNVTQNGEPSNISAVALYGHRSSNRPSSVEVKVKTSANGSFTSVGTYECFSGSYPFAPCYIELGNSYSAYEVQLVVKGINDEGDYAGSCFLAEVELYGGEVVTPLDAPTGLTATATKNSITATADSTTGGTLMFKLDDGQWQASGEFTGLTAGTTYTVYAKYVAEDGYIDSEETSITVTTAKDIEITDEIPLVPITNPNAPIVGYYSDNNTDGAITEYYDPNYPPVNLVDGNTDTQTRTDEFGYYYEELASGAKIPVYLFEFDDPRAFTGVEIDTYKAMYYGIEDFTVQVYTTDGEWVTATTVADSFSSKPQEEIVDPETYAFAEPLYGTKLRILVNKVWDMYDWRYDDDESYYLVERTPIRLREVTLMEDPDYVPPTNTQNVLKAPAYLDTTYISADAITVVAPPSTEYPEAHIQYTAYLNHQVVATNYTGVFTGLEHNTSYTFYAQYIGDGETWLNSHVAVNTTATDKDQLPAPTNVQATLGTNSIIATADPVEGGTLLYRLLDENHIAIPGMGWSENNQFTGLTAGTQYTIQVKYDGDADHYDSEITELTVVTGHILLTKPTLTVSATTHNTITLNALPTVTGGSAEYAYSTDGINWTTTTNPVITGLESNTTYSLKARYVATDSTHDTSLYSEIVTATTKNGALPKPNVTVSDIQDSSITVTADTNENGTLMFRINGGEWQESGTFTGLNRNTAYTIEAKYVGKNGYVDSDVATTTATTLKTQLSAPTGLISTDVTDTAITVTANTTVGGTLMYRINGGEWQASGTFTGLKSNTSYTFEAMYVADAGYIDSAPSISLVVTTEKGVPGTNGDYAYLEAIRESDITEHVGYNNYVNHEMYGENTVTGGYINDAMYGTAAQIKGDDVAFSREQLAAGRRLSVVFDLNNGETLVGGVELTGKPGYNITRFSIQVYNTKGQWEVVKFIAGDPFDGLETDTVMFTFKPTVGTKVRLMIEDYEENANNAPEIREMVVYEVKEDALLTQFAADSSTDAAVIDGDKVNAFTGNSVTMSFNEATSVKRLILFGDTESTSIGAFTVEVQTEKGGAWTQVYSGTGYTGANAYNTYIANFDQDYDVYGVRVNAGGTVTIPEIELYGYLDAPAPVDPNPVTTPGATAPIEATRPPVAPPAATQAPTQAFTVPTEPAGMTEPTVAVPNVSDETGSDPTVPAPVVPDESGDPVAPTAPVVTQPVTVMGWLDAIPASQITPQVGTYTGANRTQWTTLENEDDGEAVLLTNANIGNKSYLYSGALASNQVAAAVLSWSGTKTVGGVELIANTTDHATVFSIEYMDANGAWQETGVNVTSDPFTANTGYTQMYTFDPVVAKAIRIIVRDDNGTNHFSFVEATVYEVKVDNPLEKLDVTVESDKGPFTNYSTIDNVIDGEKADINVGYFQCNQMPTVITFTLSDAPKMVSRVKVYAFNKVNFNPTEIAIDVWSGSSWNNVFNGDAYTSAEVTDTFVCDFAAVETTQVRLTINDANTSNYYILTEVELYGPGEGNVAISGSGSGSYTPDASGYTEVPLSSSNLVGGCSDLNAARDASTSTNFDNIIWYFNWNKGNMNRLQGLVDGVTNPPRSTDNKTGGYSEWGMDPDEGADVFLNLDSSGTAIDQIKLYSYKYGDNYPTPQAFKVILVLKDGNQVEKTFNVEDQWTSNVADGTACTLDLGATYTVTGLYICATSNTPAITSGVTKVSLAEIELYKKNDVTLDAPTVNWTEKNDTSITVSAAKIDASIGKLQFSIDGGSSWKDAVDGSYTFENLTGNTAYTIQAKYVATASGYITSAVGSATVTTEATPATSFTVSGTTTAGATVKLYKDGAVVNTATATNGSYSFSNVSIGAYTVAVTLNGYNPQTQVITVDKNLTVPAINLTQPVYTVSGTTTAGATVKLYKDGAVVETVTADNGSYSFSNVVIGQYTLVATKDGYNAKVTEITVNQAVSQDMTLTQAVYTVTGTANAGATVTLYKNEAIVQTTTADENGAYSFSNVAIGNYSLVAKKDDHIAKSVTITVDKDLSNQNFTLEYVEPVTATVMEGLLNQAYYNVRLIEPWALRINVTLYYGDKANPGEVIPLDQMKSYGAYAIIAGLYGDEAPTSWEDIVNAPGAVQFKSTDGTMKPTGTGTTLTFDFYEGLYTYRLAENVYWVVYYEDLEGTIHISGVKNPTVVDKIDEIITNSNSDTEKVVLDSMKKLHAALIAFRGEDAELGKDYIHDDGVLNYGLNLGAPNTTGYQFGKSHSIHLIEPWGVKVSMMVKPKNGAVYTDDDFESAQNYGLIFFHDKECAYNGDMTAEQMLARNDVYVYSKTLGNVHVEDGKMVAIYDKGIYTSMLDSDVYCLPFVVVDGQYYYSLNAFRMNLVDEMYAFYNRTNLKNEERMTFRRMLELYESTVIHFAEK